ncbi:MAG: hypothetical protein ACM3RP_04230 [Chitinophagales bacterium]
MKRFASHPAILILLLSAASLFGAALPIRAAGETPAARVKEVRVELEGDMPKQSAVADRIREALAAVAEKALKGQAVPDVARLRPAVEKVVTEVFGLVLAGYHVEATDIAPGETTSVRLRLKADGPIIREVFTRLQIQGVSPELQPLLEGGLGPLDAAALRVLGGLPVSAFSWAKYALEPLVEREIARQLPGFTAKVTLEPGEVTVLSATLTPQGERVRSVNVRLSSESIPAAVLRQFHGELDRRAALMTGLPVAFLAAYRPQIQAELDRRIREAPEVARWGLKARTTLEPDVNTTLDLALESSSWRLRLEGVVSAGSPAPGPELRFTSGWSVGPVRVMVGDRLELTGLANRPGYGVGVPLGWDGELSWSRDYFGSQLVRLADRISPLHAVSLERAFPGEGWRVGYSVATDAHLRLELSTGAGSTWLSLVGNL